MGTINPAIPTIGQPNSTEDVDVRDSLTTIRDEINGNLDNANIKSAANIDGSKLASASVNGSKLVDNSVSPAKISNGTAGQLLVANSSGVITSTTVTGDVTISNTGVTAIGADKVTDTQLRDDVSTDANRAVTTNHIRDDAVDANKLRDDVSTDGNRAVTTNHIRNSAINTAKLDAGAVTQPKINTNAVGLDEAKIVIKSSSPSDFNSTNSLLGFGSGNSSTNVSLNAGRYIAVVSFEVQGPTAGYPWVETWWSNTGTMSISGPTTSSRNSAYAGDANQMWVSMNGVITVTSAGTLTARIQAIQGTAGTQTVSSVNLSVFGIES